LRASLYFSRVHWSGIWWSKVCYRNRVLGIFVQASWNFSASIFLCDRWYNWCGEMAVKGEFEKRIGEVNETIFYRT
tara:strand:+ start:153 stop:380 length:228 start_codon:yes stop_codon:yes gene_type:complete